ATAAAPMAATEGDASDPLPKERLVGGLARRWRDYGPREFARRGYRKLTARLRPAPPPAAPVYPTLTDERTIAQLRALAYLLRNLDGAAARRAAVAARRRRSDCEIFTRFPLYLVPTYPGDAALF